MSSQRKERDFRRFPGGRSLASIDIGSHTTRMLIARSNGKEIAPARVERRVTRLAKNFAASREIGSPGMQTTISALLEYRDIMNHYGVERVACGATGVVRAAANSAGFLERIAADTGILVEILSEDREAFLSAKGMLSVLPTVEGDFLAFDIGGGSTEFLLIRSGAISPAWSVSLPIGAAVITEEFLSADPPGTDAVERAANSVRSRMAPAGKEVLSIMESTRGAASAPSLTLAGTAGTVTTLAAMHLEMSEYIPYRVNGLVLDGDWLSRTVGSLSEMPLAKRRNITGLEPGREDIILGGAVIVREIMAFFGLSQIVVTDAGLLEGLLLELAEKESGIPTDLTTRLTWRLQKG